MAKGLDWGWLGADTQFANYHRFTMMDEIFVREIYESVLKVEPNDTVLDVGASIGPFTHSIRNRGASKIFCIEPSTRSFEVLTKNVDSENVVCLNLGFGETDGDFSGFEVFSDLDKDLESSKSMKFSTFIKEYDISKIDFLKTDSEGGEYAIFNDENSEWIFKNVYKIVGEWHLHTPELLEKFVKFRFRFLDKFKKFKIESVDGSDITEYFHANFDEFISYFKQVIIHIDNRPNTSEG